MPGQPWASLKFVSEINRRHSGTIQSVSRFYLNEAMDPLGRGGLPCARSFVFIRGLALSAHTCTMHTALNTHCKIRFFRLSFTGGF